MDAAGIKTGMETDKKDKLKDALELYGCNDSPLHYMMEPRCIVRIKDKNEKTTAEDFKTIL